MSKLSNEKLCMLVDAYAEIKDSKKSRSEIITYVAQHADVSNSSARKYGIEWGFLKEPYKRRKTENKKREIKTIKDKTKPSSNIP